ncbi:MAG: transcriptional regulator [Bacteroidaceae bacterium]|nr:transcriptional regulator [Bacteroidaceae bacterium]
MLAELDPLLHSQLRLAVVSLLMGLEEADFTFLREKTGATAGNLSVQIDKLAQAEYIEVLKLQSGKRPRTICRMTATGRAAFETYVEGLRTYLPL